MSNFNIHLRRFVLLLGVGLLLMARCPVMAQTKPLFRIATRIADAHTWEIANGVGTARYWQTYHWLPDGDVIFFGRNEKALTLHRRNLRTGQQQTLTALSKWIGGEHRDFDFSPDGKWLLWGGSTADDDDSFVAMLDGSHYARFPAEFKTHPNKRIGVWEWGAVQWASDSQHLIEWVIDGESEYIVRAVIRDVNAPQQAVAYPFPKVSRLAVVKDALPGERLLVNEASNRPWPVLFKEYGKPPRPPRVLTLTECGTGKTPGQTRTLRITMPPHFELVSFCLASQGNRLLLEGEVTEASLWPGGTRIPRRKRKNRKAYWVCKVDGSRMRLVGFFQRGPRPRAIGASAMWADHEPQNWEWLPDGKRVSFTFEDNLYTVSVPK